ncbi:hypothetical protein FV222_03790 [Methylobacterium sp. WL103]|uniref:hypothetical protein n=1 Tax=Methylobacterium sp. WL103 TaxID=2603891 RepID=UPI0011C701E5|nr:hypothetical protein [Methylobacterium sp. WL103]TXN06984.1 hypothetical protein FV222_03790 [Methylobacterium sp. WL103]
MHETLPVGPDDELFGRAFPDRRVHSIRTATLATGTQPKRLRKVLAANGLLPSDHAGRLDHHVIFDARAASAVLVDASDTISLISAARRLNVGRKIADALVNSGLIRRFVMADTNAGGLGTHGVSRTDVDALLELLARDAVPVDRAGKGVFKITHAAKAATRNSIDIISLIVGRKLDWVGRLVGSRGIAAILVNADEVRALLKEPELPGLTQREIMKYLRTTSGVAKTLMNQGIITTVRAVNPLTHAMINVVSEQELKCFRLEYVSLYELAQDRKDSPVGLKSRLIAAGVRPAFDPKIIKASFYRRKDVS